MGTAKRVEDLTAWQKARELVREVYLAAAEGALSRDFGLRDQLRRAAVSVMANIAEGFGRSTSKEFAHFLDIARGSAVEVQTLLYIALDVKHMQQEQFDHLLNLAGDVLGLLSGLRAYLTKLSATKQTSQHSSL